MADAEAIIQRLALSGNQQAQAIANRVSAAKQTGNPNMLAGPLFTVDKSQSELFVIESGEKIAHSLTVS